MVKTGSKFIDLVDASFWPNFRNRPKCLMLK
jgi:hypothetical protein